MASDALQGLTRQSSETIGFVLASLFSSAIVRDELREWCFKVVGELELAEAPSYLFDLADCDGSPVEIYRAIGFVRSWRSSEVERAALLGIAVRRGHQREDWPVPPAKALEALMRSPEIEGRFRETFTFIDI